MRRLTGALCLLGLAPAALAAAPVIGEWCHPSQGWILFVDAEGMGLGDNIVCPWVTAPGEAHRHEQALMCEEWRVIDGTPTLIRQYPEEVLLEVQKGGRLMLTLGLGPGEVLERCDL